MNIDRRTIKKIVKRANELSYQYDSKIMNWLDKSKSFIAKWWRGETGIYGNYKASWSFNLKVRYEYNGVHRLGVPRL